MSLFILLAIAVSLSMDAFSLSLAYGTLSLSKSHILKLSIIVGLYHFLMPLIGMLVGNYFFNIFEINPDLVVFIILTFIGVQMIFDSFKEENNQNNKTLLQLLLFGFAVSVDSFSVGIGLKSIGISPLTNAFTFSLSSCFFTFLGLNLGKKISSYIGKTSTLIGGVILIIIGIFFLF